VRVHVCMCVVVVCVCGVCGCMCVYVCVWGVPQGLHRRTTVASGEPNMATVPRQLAYPSESTACQATIVHTY